MKEKDWDRLARVYEREVCDIFRRDRRGVIAAWMRRERLLDRGRSVLDVGCGIGSFFRRHGPRFGVKTGTDHSAAMLRLAARICRRQRAIVWRQADVLNLPADLGDSADLVVCSNVITFVSLDDCRRAVDRVIRCARPRGHVMLIQPALESHDRVRMFETGRQPPARDATAVVRRDDRRQRFFTRAGIASLVEAAGLRRVQVRKVWYPWIDDGIAHAPRSAELPWDWLVTGRR